VLQCVAVCCSVLQCVAVCCSVMQRVVTYCNVLLCFADSRSTTVARHGSQNTLRTTALSLSLSHTHTLSHHLKASTSRPVHPLPRAPSFTRRNTTDMQRPRTAIYGGGKSVLHRPHHMKQHNLCYTNSTRCNYLHEPLRMQARCLGQMPHLLLALRISFLLCKHHSMRRRRQQRNMVCVRGGYGLIQLINLCIHVCVYLCWCVCACMCVCVYVCVYVRAFLDMG